MRQGKSDFSINQKKLDVRNIYGSLKDAYDF